MLLYGKSRQVYIYSSSSIYIYVCIEAGDDEIDTWVDLHLPPSEWGLKHSLTMEGGKVIVSKGALRLKVTYTRSHDRGRDIATLPLLQV